MINGLKPYAAYKDSGLQYLGNVPAHWTLKRAKYFYREVDERSVTGEEELMSVSHLTGVTPRREKNVTMFLAESNIGHKICRPGDLVINTMWAWMAALGVARKVGLVSPSYGVYRPLSHNDLLPDYVDRLLRTAAYAFEYNRRSTGINSSRLRLYPEEFLRIPILSPPKTEQIAIVRFLDHMDIRIVRYIAARQQQIKILEEQQRAIFQRAITCGLDSNVRLKRSGINWIGEIPDHWELSRVKNEFFCLNRRRVPISATDRGEMTLRQYDYYGASGVIDKVDDYLFDDSLLLIAEDGANLVLRNLPLAIIARGKFWVNNHAHVLKPKRGNLEYLAAVMEGLNYSPWISGAAQPKLTQERLMSIAIPVPPGEEQDVIIATLEATTSPLRTCIQGMHREISLLREFRARMTADIVTGQFDVREATANLPGETEESEDMPLAAHALQNVDYVGQLSEEMGEEEVIA